MRTRDWICLSACWLIAASVFAQKSEMEPVLGTWTGEWWSYPDFDYPMSAGTNWDPLAAEKMSRATPNPKKFAIELKWDGRKLTGILNPSPKAIELQMILFNPGTGAIHIETDAKDTKGNPIHYIIEGKVNKNTMSGSWGHERDAGDFRVKKK
jgi:hypothetical protein